MKKYFIAAAAAAAVFAFAACGAKKEAPAAASAPAAAPGTTVRLLTDATGIDDKSFNAAAWRGILEFYGDSWSSPANKGKLYDVVTAQTQDLYVPNLKQVSDEKYDLVIVTGFTWSDALDEVAKLYPNQKYMIVDVDWVPNPNVMQVTFSEHEGSYLVGVAAALKAGADGIAKPKFGFIGGIPGPVITKFEVGYVQGIKSVLPDAEIVDYYANDWGKPELAKAQAKNWYDSGVYAIFSAAGGTGNGTIAQAKEYRSQGKNVWAIGVDSDQYEDGVYAEGKSAVLTSMLKRVETASKIALQAVKDNSFKAEVVTLDTKSDGVGYSAKNADLGADIVAKVDAVKAKIVSGEVKVVATHKDAKALSGFPQNLQAKDE
jgi:basic membrane protein A